MNISVELHLLKRVKYTQSQTTLSKKGIPTAVHYPAPVYTQRALFESVTHCPVTTRVAERVLSLPMHPYLKPSEIQEITNIFVKSMAQV